MKAVLTNMCMLQDAAGRVLVQHRLPKKGNPWAGLTFPGGHVEPGESIVIRAKFSWGVSWHGVMRLRSNPLNLNRIIPAEESENEKDKRILKRSSVVRRGDFHCLKFGAFLDTDG